MSEVAGCWLDLSSVWIGIFFTELLIFHDSSWLKGRLKTVRTPVRPEKINPALTFQSQRHSPHAMVRTLTLMSMGMPKSRLI
jgi:hypothetical protein